VTKTKRAEMPDTRCLAPGLLLLRRSTKLHTGHHFMCNESLELIAPQYPGYTAVKADVVRRSKKCHPNFCRPITIFRVESREHRYGLYCVLRNYLHYPITFFARSATDCLSAIQTSVSTKPLTCEPNLRTILDPSGLLRDQSLAITTKPHIQLDVFSKFACAS
jgi:hypothetical protein